MIFKKISLLFLAASLCLTMSLAACDKNAEKDGDSEKTGNEGNEGEVQNRTVSDEDFEKEPVNAFARALGETLGIKDIPDETEPEKLHLSVDFESESLNIGGDYWEDAASGSAALKLNMPEIFDLGVYADGTEIVFESNSALKGAYGTDLQNIDERIKTAKIWESLGTTYEELFAEMDPEERTMIEEMIKSIGKMDFSAMENDSKKLADEYGKEFMAILNGAKHSAKTEEVELSDGKVKAVVLNYQINGELVKKLAETYKELLNDSIELVYGNMLDSVPEFTESLDEMYEIYEELGNNFDEAFKTFELNLAVASKTGKLVMAEINAENSEDGLYRIVLDLGVEPENSEQYVLNVYQAQELVGEIIYGRENSDGVYKRKAEIRTYDDGSYEIDCIAEAEIINNANEFKIDAEFTEDEYTAFDMSLEYDKESNEFSFSENTSEISFSGSFKYSDDSVEFIVDNFNGDSSMKLTVVLDDNNLPDFPRYVDILELSPEQIQSIAVAFQSFTQNVSAMFGMNYYDDDDYLYGDYEDYGEYDEY